MHGEVDHRPGHERIGYVCSTYARSGGAGCERYRAPEEPLLQFVLNGIQASYFNPESQQRLEAEIARQLGERNEEAGRGTGKLASAIAKLERDIDQGAQRILAAPPELVPLLTEKVRAWQEELKRLKAEQAAQAPLKATRLPSVAKAMDQLGNLEEKLKQADPALTRDLIRQAVARVECWFTRRRRGSRDVRTLDRGIIYPKITVSDLGLTS
jgi:hypothetical protein